MKKRKLGIALSLVLAAGTLLGACGKTDDKENGKTASDKNENKEVFSVAMVTDVGGIDDKSFNQSAWTGVKAYGKENGLEEGKKGYSYLQSQGEADYETNLNTLARQKFNLIYGIGFMMQTAVETIAKQQPDTKFAIVDGEVKQPNVASIMFKEQEGAYLAGITAGLTTKTNKIGFIGGMAIPVIERFEAGFLAGVKAVNPTATVDVQYAEAFDKAELGKTIASKMYSTGTDVIFHAAGGTGNGLFTEAKDLKKKNPSKDYWAIGVDSDQTAEGIVEVEGKEFNIMITSAMKRVDNAVKDLSTKAANGDFPGGQTTTFGLAVDGVGLAPINDAVENKADIEAKVEEFKQKIISGEITVPEFRKDVK